MDYYNTGTLKTLLLRLLFLVPVNEATIFSAENARHQTCIAIRISDGSLISVRKEEKLK